MKASNNLLDLYSGRSKHSNYQILATRVAKILPASSIEVVSRYEEERLDFIRQWANVTDKTVLDIGGNSGYFSFELLDAGAKAVHHYEGNALHARFVTAAAEALKEDRLESTNGYFPFDGSHDRAYDVCLLLNVLHHLGDDYGDGKLSIEKAKIQMLEQLNGMTEISQTVVYQMGFCWKGDRNHLLFEEGTKEEMIDFIREGVKDHWRITAIGVPQRESDGRIRYAPPSAENLKRDDDMGEFLNRPIFILNR